MRRSLGWPLGWELGRLCGRPQGRDLVFAGRRKILATITLRCLIVSIEKGDGFVLPCTRQISRVGLKPAIRTLYLARQGGVAITGKLAGITAPGILVYPIGFSIRKIKNVPIYQLDTAKIILAHTPRNSIGIDLAFTCLGNAVQIDDRRAFSVSGTDETVFCG